MENKSHALAAGAFVLGVTALLIAMALWLSRDQSDRIPVHLRSADSVSGLQPQSAVRFRGVEVGVVTDIKLDPQRPGDVIVETLIDRTAPVTTQSTGSLSSQGVTGLAFIQLDLPAEGDRGVLIRDAETTPVLRLTGSAFSRLTDQGDLMLRDLREGIQRFNRLMGEDNQQNIEQSLAQLNQSLKQMSDSAAAITQLANSANTLLHQQLDPARTNLPKLAATTQSAVEDLRAAAQQVGDAASSFQTTLSKLDVEDGPLAQVNQGAQTFNSNTLPRVNNTLENIDRTLRQLSFTVQELSENPQSVLYGTGTIAPGPGEAGFVAPQTPPNR